jgi:NADH dehydrogenase
MWKLLARAMGTWRPVLPVPAELGYQTTRLLGHLVGDVMLTREEIAGLSQDRLAVPGPMVGSRRLSDWVQQHAAELGRHYASELGRRR